MSSDKPNNTNLIANERHKPNDSTVDPIKSVDQFPVANYVSLLVLVSTLLGAINNWVFYSFFKINIFLYAEPNDLLFAFFNDGSLFMAVILYALVLYFLWPQVKRFPAYRSNFRRNLSTRHDELGFWDKIKKKIFLLEVTDEEFKAENRKNLILILVISIFLLVSWAGYFGRNSAIEIINGETLNYKVRIKGKDIQYSGLQLLGTTDRFAFFYKSDNKKVYIFTVTNVISMERTKQGHSEDPDTPS